MTGLLIKDWKLLKNQGRYFSTVLFIVILILCIGENSTSGFIISYMTFLFSIFVLSSLSYDSYDNGMAYLMSLPVGRKIYVTEKYVFAILLAVFSWVLSILLRLVTGVIQGSMGNVWEFISSSPVYLMMALFFLSYSLPVHLKFGSEKGHLISFGILGIIGFGIFTVVRFSADSAAARIFFDVLAQRMTLGTVMVFMAGCCVVFGGISYGVALRIMEKREF